MTVSTINGAASELRRVQENQNKTERPLPLQPSGASLPEDVIQVPSAPAAQPDLAEAVAQSAAQNREAAASTLSEADLDFITASQPNPAEQVQIKAKEALVAQTSRLPNNILSLLAE